MSRIAVFNAWLLSSTALSEPADKALVKKSAGQIVSTSAVALIWGAEVYDVGGWHDNVTNNTRLTTLAAVSMARCITNSLSAASNNGAILEQLKNGASFTGKGHVRATAANVWGAGINAVSAFTTVGTPGTDYFTSTLQSVSGNFTPSTETWTWAFVENLNPAIKYCFARNGSNQTTNNNTITLWSFDTIAGTQTSWHSGGNPTRITPAATLVRLTGNIQENNVAANTFVRATKNGSPAVGLPARNTNNSGGDLLNLVSAPIVMNGTSDYLEVEVTTASASAIVAGDASWIQVEEVPATYQRCLAYKTAAQPLAANTAPKVYFETSAYDTASILQTITSTVTITIASPGVVQWIGHGLENDAPVKLTTTGALPTGLTANTVYYVKNKTGNDFQLAATPGGAAINTSGTQSGTHTATNKSRLLSPVGATEARITFNASFSSSTGGIDFANTGAQAWVTKNNANMDGQPLVASTSNIGTRHLGAMSPWIPITGGTDYFEMLAHPSNGISRNLQADEYTWLCLEFR